MDNVGPARPVLPGEDEKHLTLREFEQRHADLKNLLTTLLDHERESRETITVKLEEARELQAGENKRRLDELNHAHQEARKNWETSLPREMFVSWKAEHDKWRESINLALVAIIPNAQEIATIDARLGGLEKSANKIQGAFILLGVMGLSGVVALLLGLARMAGLVE